jgi:hypothetical protein
VLIAVWDHRAMSERTPEDRELLETVGLELYDLVVQERGMLEDDARLAVEPTRAALALLADLGLVRRDGERWLGVDPGALQGQLVAPLSLEGARLLEESSHWARDVSVLAQSWRRAPATESTGPFHYLHSGPAIAAFITALMSDVTTELLTAQPQVDRDLDAGLRHSTAVEKELLARGVAIRTLYQHSARRNIATQAYAAELAGFGGEVRTLDEFFNRMIVADRRIAIIPAADDHTTALAVREPTVVAYLVDVFERSWSRGRPFGITGPDASRSIAAEQRAMTMRMLVDGQPDPTAAKRLGVSARTYAGYVSDLKREFDVETRFQLGYVLGRTPDVIEP